MAQHHPSHHHLRRDYQLQKLSSKDLAKDPIEQFNAWLDDAIKADVVEPNALALATASQEGVPSCRMVLMKHFDHKGLTFFTNGASRKALELRNNPRATAVFFWDKLERQVILEGTVEEVSRKETEEYFAMRPRGSQLGSAASNQGSPIASRQVLEESYNALEVQHQGKEIPCPAFWTGFRLTPQRYEFWQGRSDRLHDRFSYTLKENQKSWIIQRLSP